MNTTMLRGFLAFAAAWAALAGPARAATFVWQGGAVFGPQWTRDNNWTTNSPPSDGTADLIFTGSVDLNNEANNPWSIRSLTFNSSAGAFSISGSTLTIGTGGISNNDNSEQRISNDIVLAAAQTWDTTGSGGLGIFGNVNLNGNLLTINAASGLIHIGDGISGSGGLTKNGADTLLMANVANTYTGTTTVNAGTLRLGNFLNDNGMTKILGALVINGGNVTVAIDEQIANTSAVTVATGGSFQLSTDRSEDIGTLTLDGGSAGIASGATLTVDSLSMTGGSVSGLSGTLILGGNVTTSASATQANIAVGTLDLNGVTRTFTIADGAAVIDLQVNSAIATGSLTKAGDGTLQLIGTASNTHGITTVNAGTLELGKTSGATAIPGDLSIGAATVRLLADNQIVNTADVTVGDGGLLDLNTRSDTIATLTLNGGDVTTGTGTLTLGGNVTTTAPGLAVPSISGSLALGASRTFTVGDGATGADFTVSAVVSGTGSAITKAGAGTLVLSGANTFDGGLDVTAGEVAFGSDSAAGTGTLTLTAGAVRANIAARTLSVPVALNGNVTIGGTFDLTLSGAATLSGNRTLTVSNSGLTTFSGAVGQDVAGRTLTKAGTGTLVFSGTGANTYTGTTTVNAGTLRLAKGAGVNAIAGPLAIGDGTGTDTVILLANEQIANASTVTVALGSVLDLDGFDETIGGLTLNGGTINGPGTLTLGGNVTSAGTASSEIFANANLGGAARTFDVGNTAEVTDLTVIGIVSNGGIVKTGAGTLRLNSGSNTFAGGVTVNAGELAISGNLGTGTLTLNAGASIRSDTTARVVTNAVTLGGDFTVGGSLDLTFSGAATLTGNRIVTVSNTGTTVFSNAIGQDAAGRTFTKTGTGALRFSGSGSNTYTGITTVNAGTLLFAKTGAFAIAAGGGLVIGDGTGGADADVVRLETSQQIADTASVTVNSSGLLDLDGRSDVIGPVVLSGGHVTTGAGTLTLNGNVQTTASAVSARIEGNVSLGGATRTFNVASGAAPDALDLTAVLANGGVTKTGAGTLAYTGSAANTYTGTTTVNQGTLALGRTMPNTAILGALDVGDGAVVRLRVSEQIANASPVSTGNFATFDLAGFSETIGPLTMSGGNISTGAGTLTLTGNITASVSGAGHVPEISGKLDLGGARTVTVADAAGTSPDFTISATLSNGALTKAGPGTLTLSGSSPGYTGATAVAGGILLVSGDLSGSTFTIDNTGTLGGIGTAGDVTLLSGGTLAPGESAGTLHTGDVAFTLGSGLQLELRSGGPSDVLDVTGSVTLGSATLNFLFTGPVTVNDKFFIILNDGTDPVSGIFANNAEGTERNFGGAIFRFHYGADFATQATTGGNDIALVAVPEPGSAALLAVGMCALLVRGSRCPNVKRSLPRAERAD